MVTVSQTREEAFGSMRTFKAITDQATEESPILHDNRIIALALISVGALLIALGPWLAGTSQTLGSWCHHAVGISAQSLLRELIWIASEHCGYCYIGAMMIGTGIATGVRRGF
ncbi:MAG: hypothetical protein ACK5OV_01045 [bacterium]|jgi:hypothetical protein